MKLIDKEIAEEIAKANGLTISKLGLRFDKVVVQLLSNIRNTISDHIPKDKAVLLSITAPIKLPLKTEFELCNKILEMLNAENLDKDPKYTIQQNKVYIRTIEVPKKCPISFLGFVHNPDSDPKQLLDLAAHWLSKNKQ